MKPNPALTVVLSPNHSIEVGSSSWDDDDTSIRCRYDGPTGRFSPNGSSEIPLTDLQPIMVVAALNNLLSVAQSSAIIEALAASIRRQVELDTSARGAEPSPNA